MLFASATPRLTVTFRSAVNVYAPNGNIIETRPRIRAAFQHGALPPWAREIALRKLSFRGIPDGQEPSTYISAFDTDDAALAWGWNEEEKSSFEEFLTARQGIDFMRIELEKLPKPWPTYDKLIVHGRRTIDMVAEQIASKVREDGWDPETIAAYERENLNRPEVLEALAGIGEEEPELLISA